MMAPRIVRARRIVAPGVVMVTKISEWRWHVAIGHRSSVAQFNVTRAEAAELVRVLRAEVLAEGES